MQILAPLGMTNPQASPRGPATLRSVEKSYPQPEPAVSLTPTHSSIYSHHSSFVRGKIQMQRSLTGADVNFVSLQSAVFCVQCELLSENNTPRCLACGGGAVLSLSRVRGGSLRGQQTAHLIADAELDRLVRSLLYTVPQVAETGENQDEYRIGEHQIELSAAASFSSRHRMRPRHHGPVAVPHTLINAGEIDLEPGISIIAEKAQALTGATGAAIALCRGNEIVCRARTGRTAPDIGVRLQTDSGLSAECVRTGEVLLCNDAESNPRVDWASCRGMGVRSILVAPLRHFRRTLGVRSEE